MLPWNWNIKDDGEIESVTRRVLVEEVIFGGPVILILTIGRSVSPGKTTHQFIRRTVAICQICFC